MRKSMIVVGIACVLSAGPAPAGVAEAVNGKVFLDANANGKLDPGEKGIAGVAVTDSVDFVTTDAEGGYTIKMASDPTMSHMATHTVSLSWPSGYWPTGTWWARLDRIKDAENVHFGLRSEKQARPFTFAHITDNHSGSGMYQHFANQIKLMQPGLKFIVNTGDLFYTNYSDPAGDDAKQTYEAYVAGLKYIPLPLFHTIGNHDYCGTNKEGIDKMHVDYGAGLFTKYLGPTRWSFSYGGAHFVGVDWASFEGGQYKSGVPTVACEWMEKDLKRLKPGTVTVVFVHFPSGVPAFWQTASKYKVTWMLGGHGHRYERIDWGGVTATTALNFRGNGACTVGVVSDRGLDIVHRCAGCKADPEYHCKYCALRYHPPKWFQLVEDRRHQLGAKTVGQTPQTVVDTSAELVSITAAVSPGSAGKFGLRLGEKQTVEIACTPKALLVADTEVPFTVPPNDKPLPLEIYYANGWITAYVMPGLRTSRQVTIDRPGKVTLFADGGNAEFKAIEISELKLPPQPKTEPEKK